MKRTTDMVACLWLILVTFAYLGHGSPPRKNSETQAMGNPNGSLIGLVSHTNPTMPNQQLSNHYISRDILDENANEENPQVEEADVKETGHSTITAVDPGSDPLCRDYGICEDVPDYPHDEVRELVSQLSQGQVSAFFKKPESLSREKMAVPFTYSVADLSLKPVCGTKTITISPSTMMCEDKTTYVAKVAGNLTQEITITHCIDERYECAGISSVLPSAYLTYCKTVEHTRLVLTYEDNDVRGELAVRKCKVPVACVCYVSKNL